MKQPALLIYK